MCIIRCHFQTNIIALMDEADTNVMDLNPRTRFEAASSYVYEMAEQMVTVSADALVAVFVRPVTAMLPMVSEIYKLAGWWDPDRIVGSTSLERMRMEATTANLLDLNPAFLSVPMVAGADPYTIVPLLSRASPINRFTYVRYHNYADESSRCRANIGRMDLMKCSISLDKF
ncbi:Malate dehydrogenase, glyoxysomal [Dufourea novaeangliae]|uniref:Malate dehydrogenase, glyoxysomal n=1 Tax=Dufourea novaeangliae TaxID=178035 RepID=A0A154PGF8_DUFNO|nr:Malate dehydrogenase, glyoxysomal [Dufourea novaeangliae]